VRLLIDQNLSPLLAEELVARGHDAVHVRSLGMSTASDPTIMEAASTEARVLVSADADFGELLARTNAGSPSVLLLRRQDHRRAAQVAELLMLNLPMVAEDLEAGAIVVLDDDRIRVRRLPLRPVDQPPTATTRRNRA
jgi:predicted nuclease of predicted toxin-antitoxin system